MSEVIFIEQTEPQCAEQIDYLYKEWAARRPDSSNTTLIVLPYGMKVANSVKHFGIWESTKGRWIRNHSTSQIFDFPTLRLAEIQAETINRIEKIQHEITGTQSENFQAKEYE